MEAENRKHLSKEAVIAQLKHRIKVSQETDENLLFYLLNEPVSYLDVRADQAYEMIKQKGFFRSYDAATLGISQKYARERLFDTLCQRHPDVLIMPAKNPKDGRLIKIAYLDPKKLEEYTRDKDEEIKQFSQEYVTKQQLATKFNLTPDAAQMLVSRLVKEDKFVRDPEKEGRFKWNEK